MLKLYHGANSVCSIKSDCSEEKIWHGKAIISTAQGRAVRGIIAPNPRSFVPVLIHDGFILRESSVICEYIDQLSDVNPLMPTSAEEQAKKHVWGVQCLEYHDSVNTLTFASYQRSMLFAKPKDELEKRWKSMPDQIRAQDLLEMAHHPDMCLLPCNVCHVLPAR